MPVILIAFLAPLFYAFANIIECRLSNKFFKHPATMIFYISLMNCVFLPLLLLLGTPTCPAVAAWGGYIMLAAIDVLYLWPYYKALKIIDTSIVAAFFSLGQIIIPILTWFFLHEKLHTLQYAGFAIIIVSSVILSINNFKMPKINQAFYYMLIVSLSRAIYVVLEKYVLTIDGNWINMAIYTNILSGLFPFLLLAHKQMRKRIKKCFIPYMRNLKYFSINEFMCFLEMSAAVYALSHLSAVVSTSINATAPIFLLFISLVLKKIFNIQVYETITPAIMLKKILCFCGIIGGICLVVQ